MRLLVDVKLEIPADQAATKTLVVLIQDVEDALLGHKVRRQIPGSTTSHCIEKRLEGSQIVHGNIGDLEALDADQHDATGETAKLLTVNSHLLKKEMKEITPSVQSVSLQGVHNDRRQKNVKIKDICS
jgi:hypothetical protein